MWNVPYPQIWFTIGPQCKNVEVLRRIIRVGATGARLTFSYGTPELQCERASLLRQVVDELGGRFLIVADLQGEKCRLAKVEGFDEINVAASQVIRLSASELSIDGDPLVLHLQESSFLDTISSGDVILEGDGALTLEVLSVESGSAVCRVNQDGVLHPGRGLIAQGPEFRPRALTEKDRKDVQVVASAGLFDAVAVSFVADASDVLEVRELMDSSGEVLPIVAKIETHLGVKNLKKITAVADVIMAARGDLALTMPWIELPQSVRMIADEASVARKPWIIATQLVEGLERFIFPTRAEICDLANWIQSGAFGVMASYETAFGPRPVEAVEAITAVTRRYQLSDPPIL